MERIRGSAMTTVIPSVILAVTLVAVMIAVAGTMIEYYSKLYTAPVVEPPYGMIYVGSVSYKNYTVTVYNRYGFTVRSLFVVYVESMNPPQLLPPDRTVSFWCYIRPGVNIVDIPSEISRALGTELTSVVVDMHRSYFVVGSMKYPLIPGAGLYNTAKGSTKTHRYTLNGLGLHKVDNGLGGQTYVSIYFNSSEAEVETSPSIKIGYGRDIYGYETVSVVTKAETGTKCYCYTQYYSGYEWYQYACRRTTCAHSTCTSTTVDYTETEQFGCASQGGFHKYWVQLSSSWNTTVSALSLLGVSYFGLANFSQDTSSSEGGETSYVSAQFPYTTDRSNCTYDQEIYHWSASLRRRTFKACDLWCGVTRYYYTCTDSYSYSKTTQYACGTKQCAATDSFLYAKVSAIRVKAESPLDTRGKVRIKLEVDYVLDYYFAKDDPNKADDYIRILLSDTIRLITPRVAGYIGIPYNSVLKTVKAGVGADVLSASGYVETGSGYTASVPVSVSVSAKACRVVVEPSGYVQSEAKTFSYYTVVQPSVEISVSTPSEILVPMKDSDTVTIKLVLELELDPTVEAEEEIVQW